MLFVIGSEVEHQLFILIMKRASSLERENQIYKERLENSYLDDVSAFSNSWTKENIYESQETDFVYLLDEENATDYISTHFAQRNSCQGNFRFYDPDSGPKNFSQTE